MKNGCIQRSALIAILLLFILYPEIAAQTPWAEITTADTAICESGNMTFKVHFTGNQPFGFRYKTTTYGTTTTPEIKDRYTTPIFNDSYTETFPVGGGGKRTDSVVVEIIEVYDNTVSTWEPGKGVAVTGEDMTCIVDHKPSPSAGNDISGLCGYTTDLDATPEFDTAPSYWAESPYGSFTDRNDPKTTFKAATEGSYTLWFVEESGVCKDSASVDVELLGSPKASISGSETICSTDGNPNAIAISIDLQTDSLPYSFTISDGVLSPHEFRNVTSDTTVNIQAEDNQTFKMIVLSDIRNGKECFAPAEDITGEAVVTDLKPAAYPGISDTVCGSLSTKLEASLENAGNTGLWSGDNVTFGNATDPKTTATVVTHGFYTLTWTETEPVLGCKDSNQVVVNFAETPGLTYSKDTAICSGSIAVLQLNATGNAPWTLSYTFDETSTDITLNSPEETRELNPKKTTTVYLDSITGTYGCVTKINGKYKITVDEMPHAFAGGYDPVCSNQIQLSAVPSIINSKGFWQGTGTFDDPTSPQALFTAAGYGEQQLTWIEENTQNPNCKDISITTIRFDKTPDDPNAGQDKKIYLEYSTELDAEPASPGVGTWSADIPEITFEDPNDPNTIVDNLKMGKQTLTWTVVNGVCDAKSDELTIEVKGLTSPNGFSPNGDGRNDFLKIMGAPQIQDNELKVFDRNGKVVFEAKDYKNDWDGTGMDGSPLDDGTYYYIFTGKNIDPVKEYLIIKRTKNNR